MRKYKKVRIMNAIRKLIGLKPVKRNYDRWEKIEIKMLKHTCKLNGSEKRREAFKKFASLWNRTEASVWGKASGLGLLKKTPKQKVIKAMSKLDKLITKEKQKNAKSRNR